MIFYINRVQYFDDEIHDYMGDNHYLVDTGMKNVKKNILVILFALLSMLIILPDMSINNIAQRVKESICFHKEYN
jgi:hypothetical protein